MRVATADNSQRMEEFQPDSQTSELAMCQNREHSPHGGVRNYSLFEVICVMQYINTPNESALCLQCVTSQFSANIESRHTGSASA